MDVGVLFCPLCGGSPERWLPGPGGRPDARCPFCSSLERHRFLAYIVGAITPSLRRRETVLDVAPHEGMRMRLERSAPDALYVGMDYLEPQREIDLLADLTRLPFRGRVFDLIVCYHVLEHVPDDRAGMRELHRVLGDGGVALVQVPRRSGTPTDEDVDAPAEERAERFGQEDHVRYYGDDFEDRLRDAGLEIELIVPEDQLTTQELLRTGTQPREPVWICYRSGEQPPITPWPLVLPRLEEVVDRIEPLPVVTRHGPFSRLVRAVASVRARLRRHLQG